MTSLLKARGLVKSFRSPGGRRVQALRGVDLDVSAGRTLAVVGESGCGKSTLARCLVRLLTPDAGTIELDGDDLLALRGAELRRKRREFQLVFQDPGGSLDPRMRIGPSLEEPLRIHRLASKAERPARVEHLLAEVGLPREVVARFPHQLSGGQRQRVAIARALASEPRLLVADEPVSGLDVSLQSQIIDLLTDLQQRRALALVLIAHDLGLVESASHEVAVLYLGRVVEQGVTAEVFRRPMHPYTAALLASAPRLNAPAMGNLESAASSVALRGEIPDPADPPSGCALHPRCPRASEHCSRETPPLEEMAPKRFVACFHPVSAPVDVVADTCP